MYLYAKAKGFIYNLEEITMKWLKDIVRKEVVKALPSYVRNIGEKGTVSLILVQDDEVLAEELVEALRHEGVSHVLVIRTVSSEDVKVYTIREE